ncbi:MAG: DUF2165 family protein [Wenzhouxiangellaceae bacterium]|nr:DUF2165 family protein [Wenzhouxiangellaceae bacterium]
MIRWLKIVLVIFVGLQGLFYFISNAFNWSSAMIAVGTVLGQGESPFYTNTIIPPITSPLLVTIALLGIMTAELLVGLISFKGAWDMKRNVRAGAGNFNASKKFAILGCGLALIVWFGIFQVFGAALFQMWQGEVGIASFEGAFMYHAASALVLLFVNQPDD